MKIIPLADHPCHPGTADWFTGQTWRDEIAGSDAPGNARVLRVTFAPGARTHWHTHPVGQVLHVLVGVGRVQLEGGPVQEIHPGETVLIAAGEKHWHGASPTRLMSHLAVQEIGPDGSTTHWLEPVTDAQYSG